MTVQFDHTPTAVIGLGFGDEGKGMAVAHECRRIIDATGRKPIVVRFNGGPQAAHNVRIVEDGRILHHTHSQFGSGAMLGAYTILAKGMLVDPIAMVNEGRSLEVTMRSPNVFGRVKVDLCCPVVTPSHADVNRAIEHRRGDGRHGSTGRGIGVARACEEHAMEHGLHVFDVGTLFDRYKTTSEVVSWRGWMREHFGVDVKWSLDAGAEAELLCGTIDYMFWRGLSFDHGTEWFIRNCIYNDDDIVFEGSQGMLLDERYGWFPHVTYGDMTPSGAADLADGPVRVLGVTRSYQTRHGDGPMVTEGTCDIMEYDNEWSEWAGKVRTGLLDLHTTAKMAREIHADGIVVSNLDRYPGSYVVGWRLDENGGRASLTSYKAGVGEFLREVAHACDAPVTTVGMGDTLSNWKDL